VKAWIRGTRTFDQYFDDLESFAWVLLWAVIEIAEAKGNATALDKELMKSLNRDNLENLREGKGMIINELKDLSESSTQDRSEADATSLFDPFIEILVHWFDLIKAKGHGSNSETVRSSEESTALYKAFITFAMEKMDELPDAWNFKSQSPAPSRGLQIPSS